MIVTRAPEKKSNVKWILLAAVITVALVVGVWWFFFRKTKDEEPEEEPETPTPTGTPAGTPSGTPSGTPGIPGYIDTKIKVTATDTPNIQDDGVKKVFNNKSYGFMAFIKNPKFSMTDPNFFDKNSNVYLGNYLPDDSIPAFVPGMYGFQDFIILNQSEMDTIGTGTCKTDSDCGTKKCLKYHMERSPACLSQEECLAAAESSGSPANNCYGQTLKTGKSDAFDATYVPGGSNMNFETPEQCRQYAGSTGGGNSFHWGGSGSGTGSGKGCDVMQIPESFNVGSVVYSEVRDSYYGCVDAAKTFPNCT